MAATDEQSPGRQTSPADQAPVAAPYASQLPVPMPRAPALESYDRGFLGIGGDGQARAHERRALELYHRAVEAIYAEQYGLLADLKGLQMAREASSVAEGMWAATDPRSGTHGLMTDMVHDTLARIRFRHNRVMDATDSNALNTIQGS